MHLFIPSFDAARTDHALQEACRLVRSGDRVTIMVPVIVPADLPVNVGAGEIWKRVCEAERRVFHTREAAEQLLPPGVHLRCMRVQARDQASAILAGIENYLPDCLLLALPGGIRGAFAMHFGTIPAVMRDVPCGVRLVGATTRSAPRPSVAARDDAAPLSALQVIAVNPALAASGAENGMRKSEGQHAW